jgi:hypothetical protein
VTKGTKPKSEKPEFPNIEEETGEVTINNELDFGRWYHEVENGLLDASYEDYQYVQSIRYAVAPFSI